MYLQLDLPAVKWEPPTLLSFPSHLEGKLKMQKAQQLNMWQPGWSAPNMLQDFLARNISRCSVKEQGLSRGGGGDEPCMTAVRDGG